MGQVKSFGHVFGARRQKYVVDSALRRSHPVMMKITPLAGCLFTLTGCVDNPTIDQEIAGKCGISFSEYQKVETTLNQSRDGTSLRAGRCRFTHAANGTIDGTIVEDT